MIYRYECKEHGEFELKHSIKDNRNEKECLECGKNAQPLISNNVGMQLTGRPPWAYNDARRTAASLDHNKGKGSGVGINKDTTITDKREGSSTYGKKMKLNKDMGGFNAQW